MFKASIRKIDCENAEEWIGIPFFHCYGCRNVGTAVLDRCIGWRMFFDLNTKVVNSKSYPNSLNGRAP